MLRIIAPRSLPPYPTAQAYLGNGVQPRLCWEAILVAGRKNAGEFPSDDDDQEIDDVSVNGVIDAPTDEEETGAEWDFGGDLDDTGDDDDDDESDDK